MSPLFSEWLEADGLGGFASGTVSGRRTRRYHAWLLTATTPPTGRLVLVNGAEVQVVTPQGTFPLSTQLYAPYCVHPDGHRLIAEFTREPWPTWVYRLPDGTQITHDLFVPHGSAGIVLRWRMDAGASETKLIVRPLMSGRDYHCLHHSNPVFRSECERSIERLVWQPYPGLPEVIALTNGSYEHRPMWFYNFRYEVEAERGLDCDEDLISPGEMRWDLGDTDAVCVWTTNGPQGLKLDEGVTVRDWSHQLVVAERKRRQKLASGAALSNVVATCEWNSSHGQTVANDHVAPETYAALLRAADAYIVQRGSGKTIIAGYPWFTDWGRDTFIALRGLCLTTGRLADAERILVDWAGTVSEGMLPNRFPDYGSEPEFNSVDASLWFIIAVHDFLLQVDGLGAAKKSDAEPNEYSLSPEHRCRLLAAIDAILTGYATGTRFGIRSTPDGLLQAGVPGVQLTWMDAKVGDWVVTPRIGKPVEIQALWLNALHAGAELCESAKWQHMLAAGTAEFREQFWNEASNCLFDVVDADHVVGRVDGSIRPNQLLAVGGLPIGLLDEERARRVVDIAESLLLTPLGLRTLNRTAPQYHAHFTGSIHARDAAYHQGTVWPWLLGPFVDAWLRVRGRTPIAKAEARKRFIAPLIAHLEEAGLGHVSEVADGDAPHTPRGCPFQAWSLGELLRVIAWCA